MSRMRNLFCFCLGTAVGVCCAWQFLQKRYASLAEKEIASVKESYAKYHQKMEGGTKTMETSNEKKNRYTEQVKKEGYVDYSQTVPESEEKDIYIIESEEFGEMEDYAQVSLFYFTDGILADEYGETVEDILEAIDDKTFEILHMEESVFLRNDTKRCDYEILKDLRSYDEFLDNLPPMPR